jgi:glycosyltransferase involved in cell wall biosynthesis
MDSIALSYSTGVVCISRAVADELHAMSGIDFPRPMKIGYWRLGANFGVKALPPAATEQRATRCRSFLMVGTIEPRKGHRVALDAFEVLWADGFDGDLVIVGKRGWGNDHLIERLRNHPEAGYRLHWHAQVSDEALQRLYAESDALIAASFAEGFGLPIVEVHHFGKPVIVSDIPVFREVTGGAQSARFFAVGSPTALAEAVRGFASASNGAGWPRSERLYGSAGPRARRSCDAWWSAANGTGSTRPTRRGPTRRSSTMARPS